MSPYIDKMRLWAWRLATATSILVAALTALGGAGLTRTVVRAVIAWTVIYGLVRASIMLFEQTASRPAFEEARGRRVDVAVGLEGDALFGGEPDLKAEIKDQAEETLPGQVDPQLAEGLEDAGKQAEIVRRMGWGQQ